MRTAAAVLDRVDHLRTQIASRQGEDPVTEAHLRQAERDIARYMQNPSANAPKTVLPNWGARPRWIVDRAKCGGLSAEGLSFLHLALNTEHYLAPSAPRVALSVSASCFWSMPKSQPRLIRRHPESTRALTS